MCRTAVNGSPVWLGDNPYEKGNKIINTARFALFYAKEPNIKIVVRIAATKVCDELVSRVPEMYRYRPMLDEVVAIFRKHGIEAKVVDVSKEPWF